MLSEMISGIESQTVFLDTCCEHWLEIMAETSTIGKRPDLKDINRLQIIKLQVLQFVSCIIILNEQHL